MRTAGVLAVSSPLPRVYVRLVWPPDRRVVTCSTCAAVLLLGLAHQHHRPHGRANAGAARRLCADLHVVFILVTLSAAHDKAHKPRSVAIRLISALRGSAGAVLQRGCASLAGLKPEISQEPPTQRPLAAPAPPQRALSAQATRSRAPASLSALVLGATASVHAPAIIVSPKCLRRRYCPEPRPRRTDVTGDAGQRALQHGHRHEHRRRQQRAAGSQKQAGRLGGLDGLATSSTRPAASAPASVRFT